MIEKMKIVRIVTTAPHKKDMLDALRELGVVHFAEKRAADAALTQRFSELDRFRTELIDFSDRTRETAVLSDEAFDSMYRRASEAKEKLRTLADARSAAVSLLESVAGWGEFDPKAIAQLRGSGIELHFLPVGKREYAALCEEAQVIPLTPVSAMTRAAVVGPVPAAFAQNEFALPDKGPEDIRREIEGIDAETEACRAILKDAARYDASFNDQLLKAQNDSEYSSVANTADAQEGLVFLTGYLPAADEAAFREAAGRAAWAYAIGDPEEDDEHVPTKIRYTRLTRLITPVFDILGTVPGYREYDISFWFLCFFTLFFAMIIGDAGYGTLFLLGTVALTLKTKKTTNVSLLLFVLSGATMVWGAITGNWFGLEGAMNIPLLRALVIPSLAAYPEVFGVAAQDQQNSVMKLCFIIGMVQLALACVMNIRKKVGQKNLSWIADVGWLCSICALYFVVLFLVIGEEISLTGSALAVLFGFLLVVLFGGMAPDKSFSSGLKAGLGNIFTDFLDTISAFGNIMSYIRLFAVGMASLAIAQSFNNMALGFTGPLAIAGAAIMIVGHLLNIVMGFLSVVVHGVRLNLLEFSGQLGMEWFGTAYAPFKKHDKVIR